MKIGLVCISFAAVLSASAAEWSVTKNADHVEIKNTKGVRVLQYQLKPLKDSKLAVETACYFHPVTTPSGVVMTEVAPADHPHHRGIFLAWVEMHGKKGADFWGWGQHAPRTNRVIVNRSISDIKTGGSSASFRAQNEWLAEGEAMIQERMDATIRESSGANILDLFYTLTPLQDITLSRWAFSGFCVRTRKDGKLTANGPEGVVTLKNPKHTEPETDWPDKKWYAYNLKLDDGKEVAVAVFNHFQNPPSRWHNHRDVRMLNPCIVAPGAVQLKQGQPLKLRYRVIFRDGEFTKELIAAQ